MTIRRYLAAAAVAAMIFPLPAWAALSIGTKAPDFTLQASQGGNAFTFNLADSLKKGPVVLYFFPKAFTSGCTVEAHEFAEAAAEFSAAGATLIGMSSDDIGTLHEFSEKECSAKFPVAADPDLKVIRAYDSVLARIPGVGGVADRISYVISTDGKVEYSYSDGNPDKHVENTLAEVKKLQAAK